MLLTPQQQEKVKNALDKIQSNNRYETEDGFDKLRAVQGDVKPYMTYLLHSGPSRGIMRVLETYRDAWSANLLYEILETAYNQKLAQQAWHILKTMGKLPKEWRKPKFTQDLWEACRTKPSEIPIRNDDWTTLVKWNLLFKLMDDNETVRNEAMDEFGYIGTSATLGLMSALDEGDHDMSKTALVMLKRVGDNRALEKLKLLSDDENTTIRILAKSAHDAVSERKPTMKSVSNIHQSPSQKTLDDYAQWTREIASPTLSGQFDARLERRVIRALLRISAPDPDEQITGSKEFDRMGEEALPILRYYAKSGRDTLKRQATSIIKAHFS